MHWIYHHCHHDDRLPLSCGHRHCPQCQQRTTIDWLQRQKQKQLPVHYFMVTFTLPYQLRVLARHQPKAIYNGIFKVASRVLKDFANRQQQCEMGFTAMLHTHSRQCSIWADTNSPQRNELMGMHCAADINHRPQGH